MPRVSVPWQPCLGSGVTWRGGVPFWVRPSLPHVSGLGFVLWKLLGRCWCPHRLLRIGGRSFGLTPRTSSLPGWEPGRQACWRVKPPEAHSCCPAGSGGVGLLPLVPGSLILAGFSLEPPAQAFLGTRGVQAEWGQEPPWPSHSWAGTQRGAHAHVPSRRNLAGQGLFVP